VPGRRARRLVVDASVAGAAGRTEAPTSKRCRDFLLTLRDETECRVVMPPKLRNEWEDHMSGFTRVWLRNMTQRGRVVPEVVPPSVRMRREIERVAATKKSETEALRKDFHLVEAAIAHDRTVISSDEIVRLLFKRAATSVTAVKKIVWVNPVKEDEEPLTWLRVGAKAENIRMLGHIGSVI
jgi:hypothetical protein